MVVLAIDTGTTETGYSIVDAETMRPVQFGKVYNSRVLDLIESVANEPEKATVVLEGFACYGMPVGQSTIESVTWNGRYIQRTEDCGLKWTYIYRKDEKMNLCGTMKAKDSNIRQSLIDRFGEVGTKKNPGWFYGFAKDAWSAYAIAVTYLDRVSYITQNAPKMPHNEINDKT